MPMWHPEMNNALFKLYMHKYSLNYKYSVYVSYIQANMPLVFSCLCTHYCSKPFYICGLYTLQHHWLLKNCFLTITMHRWFSMCCILFSYVYTCAHMVWCHTYFCILPVQVPLVCDFHVFDLCLPFKLLVICIVLWLSAELKISIWSSLTFYWKC